MYNASDLYSLGKAISKSYINGSADLTGSLQKTAARLGLNENQVQRVAETANVETYVSLLKTADDKYINFDLADASKIEVKKSAPEKTAFVNDYEKPASYKFSAERLFGDPEDPTEGEAQLRTHKHASQIKDTLDYLSNALEDELLEYKSKLNKLGQVTKQQYLQDCAMDIPYTAVKLACNDFTDKVWGEVQGFLKNSSINIDKEYEQRPGWIQTTSDYYKLAESINNSITQIVKISAAINSYQEKLAETEYGKRSKLDYTEKTAGVVGYLGKGVDKLLSSVGHGVWGTTQKHPQFAGGVVLGGGVYNAGKNKGKSQQGEILQNLFVNVKKQK